MIALPHVWRVVPVLIVSALAALARGEDKPVAPTFKIECKKPADSISIVPEQKRTLMVVTSETGIGGATIDLKSGEWPADVTVQFRYARGGGFKMLENFELTGGHWKVAGQPREAGKLPLQFADAEGKFDHREPAAGELDVRLESKATGMEIVLPANLLVGAKQIQLQWIDAYR